MARRYDIEGGKTLLYWAIGLFLLCIWCVRDGWFPTESKAKQHTEYLAFQTTKGDWISADKAVKQDDKTWKTAEGRHLERFKLKAEKVDVAALTLPEKPDIAVLPVPEAFYFLFNKSFAILSALGSLGCLIAYLRNR